MTKLEITGKETDEELAIKALTVLSELCAEIVGDVIETARSVPSGLKDFVETQLRTQDQGEGAMKAHFIFYALSILPEHDQTCLLSNLFQGANFEEIEKKKPTIWLTARGDC